MPDWNTRLAVSYEDESGATVDITPIDSFQPTFAINSEVMHSLEETHVGMIFSPAQITFNMQVRACGDVAAKLTSLAMKGQHFDVTLQEQTGDDWAFSSVVLSDCLITNAVPTSASPTGAPIATFSGVSLGAEATDKDGAKASLPSGTAE